MKARHIFLWASLLATGLAYGGTPVGTSYCVSTINSTGTNATIAGIGSASISQNNLTLIVSDVPTVPGLGIPIGGTFQEQFPVFDGFLCIGPQSLQRINQIIPPDATGTVTQPIDITGASTGTAVLNVMAGQTYNYQYWFRDPLAAGTGANFSTGLAVLYTP